MQGTKISPLIYADSESNADQLYFSKVFVPDPFLSFGIGKKKYAIVNDLEYTRLKKEAVFDDVLSLGELQKIAEKRFRKKKTDLSDIIRIVVDEYKIRSFVIPPDFPVRLALGLIKKKIKFKVSRGSLFPSRAIKNDEEAKAIREGNAASAAGIRMAEYILDRSSIKNGKIYYGSRYLTSERLREEIEITCLKKGGIASHTITAGGNQACDPHCQGYGVLRANEFIVVDVFPRIKHTGYYGDMTRTFLKGRSNENQQKLISTVKKAHRNVLGKLKGGISASKVHNEVKVFFKNNGYITSKNDDIIEGYFHGTGHGLGLEIHEEPSLSSNGSTLKTGMVVTVEPGLYYPGLGGCRIEDVVRIKRDGIEMLSKCHYRWEIS